MPKAHRIIPPLTSKDISRFWDKVDRNGPEPCWEWKAARNVGGYGAFSLDGRRGAMFAAHRIAWFLAHGPIAPQMCVCHICDNPPCVNVAHLFLGRIAENNKDMASKGRVRIPRYVGQTHPQAKLTEEEVREIRNRYASGGIFQRTLATEYGVSQRLVWNIVHRHIWKHVD